MKRVLALLISSLMLLPLAADNGRSRAFAQLSRIAQSHRLELPGSADEMVRLPGESAEVELYALQRGGFAIVDRQGELLAYSLSGQLTDSLSPAFSLWQKLAAGGINADAAQVLSQRAEEQVLPLVHTQWSQSEPYNNELVLEADGKTYRFVTGCGATALAQVMKRYDYPETGRDSHSYTKNYTNIGSVVFACNFAERTYDWAHMTDTYGAASTAEEKAAVAMLMRDAGHALEMAYNGNASSSVLFHQVAALRCFFGYSKHIRYYERNQKSAAKWAEMIYSELAAGRPILYAATDAIAGGGHAFVIDGYDAEGLVHVNWGWGGAGDGYYQLALLNPTINDNAYEYSVGQMMVIGIQPTTETLVSKTVNVQRAGSLRSLLTDEDMTSLQQLTVSGALNAADVLTIRRLAGFDSLPNTFTDGVLTSLDLTDATIVAGGGNHYDSYTTKAGQLPAWWFLTMDPATNLAANYGGLTEIRLPAEGLTSIGSQSLGNQKAITRLEIPASVRELGVQSLWAMDYHLRDLKVGATSPAATGDMTFASYTNVNPFLECRVYVPDGSISAYQTSNQYWRFFEHILGHSAYAEEDTPSEPPVSGWQETEAADAAKQLIDGQIRIVRSGCTYDLLGRRMK